MPPTNTVAQFHLLSRLSSIKKCSKSHHHALAELNITPLLDLAFVLLVIFIITTTPIVNDLELDLPKAASRPKDPSRKSITSRCKAPEGSS